MRCLKCFNHLVVCSSDAVDSQTEIRNVTRCFYFSFIRTSCTLVKNFDDSSTEIQCIPPFFFLVEVNFIHRKKKKTKKSMKLCLFLIFSLSFSFIFQSYMHHLCNIALQLLHYQQQSENCKGYGGYKPECNKFCPQNEFKCLAGNIIDEEQLLADSHVYII